MEDWILAGLALFMHGLAVPNVGLGAVFLITFVSATLLPLGSEPAVFGLVKLQPDLFWPAILIATLGNTLGGAVTWWMGRGVHVATDKILHHDVHGAASSRPEASPAADRKSHEIRAMLWLQRFGAKACLLSWLPIVGDPLCAVAGWLKLPFWPCVFYMAIGKLARYVSMTFFLLWVV